MFNILKNEKNIHKMCTKSEVHIFNMWTIIMQSLNKKKWKLLELQITQTRHPKSVADGRTLLHLDSCWVLTVLEKVAKKA